MTDDSAVSTTDDTALVVSDAGATTGAALAEGCEEEEPDDPLRKQGLEVTE